MKNSSFFPQAELLLKVLPLIAEESIFALKGGTAINLFLRDMPRLSVDIDLTYLPIKSRDESLNEIGLTLKRIKTKIETALKGSRVALITVAGTTSATSLTVEYARVQIKVEVNFVLRGSAFPTISYKLCQSAQDTFGAYVEVIGLSKADLYGGKFCAALDRQHPRDFFDIKILLDNEGITNEIRKGFVIYLASHSRPMNELLNPTWKDISEVFKVGFQGMPAHPVTLSDLLKARDELLKNLLCTLTQKEKEFLVSVKRAEPDWSLIEVPEIDKLPGLQWKLINIRKMRKDKHELELKRLEKVLGL